MMISKESPRTPAGAAVAAAKIGFARITERNNNIPYPITRDVLLVKVPPSQ